MALGFVETSEFRQWLVAVEPVALPMNAPEAISMLDTSGDGTSGHSCNTCHPTPAY